MTGFSQYSFLPAFAAYTSHKRVKAAKITAIHGPACVGVGEFHDSISYDPKGKPTPEIGWYVIAYPDGYISFSPPDQFECGYSADKGTHRWEMVKADNAPDFVRRIPVPGGWLYRYGEGGGIAFVPGNA